MRRSPRAAIAICAFAAAVAVAAGTAAPGTASAITDATPPEWSKPPSNAIRLGTQVNPAILGSCDSWHLPVRISWSARDPESGISHYGYSGYDSGSEDATLTQRTSLTLTTWVVDDICGGGGAEENVYAWNGAGLHASWRWRDEGLAVVQDDALTPSFLAPWVGYNGNWRTSACDCWSGGTTQHTRQSGASATLSLPYDPFGDGGPYVVGVLMARAPNRGKAAIFVDGHRVAAIDTGSSSPQNRTVVWRQTVPPDTETVKVVNLARGARTRVDVDAFVLLQKRPGYPLDPDLY